MTGAVHGLRGLQADVTIDHGAGGVPTVRASCLSDGWAGLGHAVATDRLFQLDLLRRSAAGRLAELFGPSAVAQDIAQRRAGLTAAADRALGELPADQRAVLTAYTDGVNAVIATAPPPLELEVLGLAMEPWRPRDSLLVALLLAQMLSGDGEHHRMRALMAGSLPPMSSTSCSASPTPISWGWTAGRPPAGRPTRRSRRCAPCSPRRRARRAATARSWPPTTAPGVPTPWPWPARTPPTGGRCSPMTCICRWARPPSSTGPACAGRAAAWTV